jgi:hypothetical protein
MRGGQRSQTGNLSGPTLHMPTPCISSLSLAGTLYLPQNRLSIPFPQHTASKLANRF